MHLLMHDRDRDRLSVSVSVCLCVWCSLQFPTHIFHPLGTHHVTLSHSSLVGHIEVHYTCFFFFFHFVISQ